jgi:hypothetical protein
MRDIGALKAPGAMFPVSSSPSSSTTRCVVVSRLCQTTVCPTGTVDGFGENDCAPLMPRILIVIAPGGGADGLMFGVVGDTLP